MAPARELTCNLTALVGSGQPPTKALLGPILPLGIFDLCRQREPRQVSPPPRQKLNRQPNNQDLSMFVTRDCN